MAATIAGREHARNSKATLVAIVATSSDFKLSERVYFQRRRRGTVGGKEDARAHLIKECCQAGKVAVMGGNDECLKCSHVHGKNGGRAFDTCHVTYRWI